MNNKEIECTNCSNCPFCHVEFDDFAVEFPYSSYCDAIPYHDPSVNPVLDVGEELSNIKFKTPDWCPLKKHSITVTLNEER